MRGDSLIPSTRIVRHSTKWNRIFLRAAKPVFGWTGVGREGERVMGDRQTRWAGKEGEERRVRQGPNQTLNFVRVTGM